MDSYFILSEQISQSPSIKKVTSFQIQKKRFEKRV